MRVITLSLATVGGILGIADDFAGRATEVGSRRTDSPTVQERAPKLSRSIYAVLANARCNVQEGAICDVALQPRKWTELANWCLVAAELLAGEARVTVLREALKSIRPGR